MSRIWRNGGLPPAWRSRCDGAIVRHRVTDCHCRYRWPCGGSEAPEILPGGWRSFPAQAASQVGRRALHLPPRALCNIEALAARRCPAGTPLASTDERLDWITVRESSPGGWRDRCEIAALSGPPGLMPGTAVSCGPAADCAIRSGVLPTRLLHASACSRRACASAARRTWGMPGEA
jgi:hypothetical protein